MKVTIKNFQSIEDCSFEIPEKAFTCIVGPSNIGKSAIRRAIGCVLYNNSDISFIRKGTKECSVEITFDDGLHVLWSRSEQNAGSYKINGEEYSKLNKTVPKPILDKGFKDLVLSKDRLNVQIASQFDHIFLLNETGSKVTEIFSNLGNLNKIILANRACSSDLKSNKSRLTIRKEDFISAKEKIKNYRGLDEQAYSLEVLKSDVSEIKVLKNKQDLLKICHKKLDKSVNLVKMMQPVKSIEIEHTDIDAQKLINASRLNKQHDSANFKKSVYEKLSEISDIIFNLGEDEKVYSKLKALCSKYLNLSTKMEFYKNEVIIPELEKIEMDKIKSLQNLNLKLNVSKTELLKLRAEIQKTEDNQKILELDEKNLRKELKVCPLCNKSFEEGCCNV